MARESLDSPWAGVIVSAWICVSVLFGLAGLLLFVHYLLTIPG